MIAPVERLVRLFRNGSNQALRIPRDMELPGDTAFIRRDGNFLVVEPAAGRSSLLGLLATLEPLDEEFPDVDADLPALDAVQL